MATTTWADSIIRVNKNKEQSFKMQIAQALGEIELKERKIGQMRELLQKMHKKVQDLMEKAISPPALSQFLVYCDSIRHKIRHLHEHLERLKLDRLDLERSLKAVARQRILLESIQKKYVAQVKIKVAKREELLASELSRPIFIADI